MSLAVSAQGNVSVSHGQYKVIALRVPAQDAPNPHDTYDWSSMTIELLGATSTNARVIKSGSDTKLLVKATLSADDGEPTVDVPSLMARVIRAYLSWPVDGSTYWTVDVYVANRTGESRTATVKVTLQLEPR